MDEGVSAFLQSEAWSVSIEPCNCNVERMKIVNVVGSKKIEQDAVKRCCARGGQHDMLVPTYKE